MCGTLVCIFGLTSIAPRSVSFTPVFSNPYPSVRGLNPIACKTRSCGQYSLFAFRGCDGDANITVRLKDRIHARAGHSLDTAFTILPIQFRRNLFVLQGYDAVQKLDHGHIHTIAIEDVRELDTDCSRAGDNDA